MKTLSKLAIIATTSLALAGCSETLGGLAVIGAGIGAFMNSASATPDYTKYAETCKEIAIAVKEVVNKRADTIATGIASPHAVVAGQSLMMLAYEKDSSVALFQKCMIAGPKSFITTLAENTDIGAAVLQLYGINRREANNKRTLEANKELGLARMEHDETINAQDNKFITDLAGRRERMQELQTGAE